MIDVAQYINEVKRDSELLVVLSKIQVNFTVIAANILFINMLYNN